MRILAFVLILSVAGVSSAAQAQCTYPNTLTNSTPADATAVMQNFDGLKNSCAPLASPNFTGTVGIGMTASNVLDITQNQNAGAIVKVLNSNGGSGAFSVFRADNGTRTLDLAMYGTGASAYGAISSGQGALYTAATGLVLMSDNGSGVIKFASGGSSEKARFGSDGSFLVGTTTNSGYLGFAKMEVMQAAASSTAISAWGAAAGVDAFTARVDATSGNFLSMRYNGTTVVGTISTNGTTTAYNTTSDARLKSNVVDLSAERAIRALRAYRPQEYLLRGKPGIGALAQDVDRRFSAAGLDAAEIGLVSRGDGNRALKAGDQGFKQWSMDSAKMVPFIIATSLDHDNRLKSLEAENTALRRQVSDLARTVALLEQSHRRERQAAAPAERRAAR